MTTALAVHRPSATVAAVVVPPVAEESSRSWRRMVTGIDAAQRGAFALQGPWLDADAAYHLPVGAVVVTCDQFPRHRDIRMLRVDVGGLAEEKAWRQKAALGARVLQYLGRGAR